MRVRFARAAHVQPPEKAVDRSFDRLLLGVARGHLRHRRRHGEAGPREHRAQHRAGQPLGEACHALPDRARLFGWPQRRIELRIGEQTGAVDHAAGEGSRLQQPDLRLQGAKVPGVLLENRLGVDHAGRLRVDRDAGRPGIVRGQIERDQHREPADHQDREANENPVALHDPRERTRVHRLLLGYAVAVVRRRRSRRGAVMPNHARSAPVSAGGVRVDDRKKRSTLLLARDQRCSAT